MFRNISINEKLWSFELGDCKVVNINREEEWFTATNGIENYCYNFSGIYGYNVRPTIFWSEPKVEIPVKPFDLKGFLKESIQPEEFKKGGCNLFLAHNSDWYIGKSKNNDIIGTVYFDFKNKGCYIPETLNEEQITPKQLKQAFKELGWL